MVILQEEIVLSLLIHHVFRDVLPNIGNREGPNTAISGAAVDPIAKILLKRDVNPDSIVASGRLGCKAR